MYYKKRTLRRLIICRREYLTPAMKAFLSNPGEYLDKTTEAFFKNAPWEPTTVGVVVVDNKKLVVKRYNVEGFWHSLKNIFRHNRALVCWKNSHYLEMYDIPTPKAVAVLIDHFDLIRRKSYYITEYIDGIQGRIIFYKDSKDQASWSKLLGSVSVLLEKLYAARITHDDFQQSNMIFVNEIPVLLDLDHMRIHRYNSFWFRYNFRKDLRNFLTVLAKVNPEAHQMAKNIMRQDNKH